MTSHRRQDRASRQAADWFARLNADRVSVADLEAFRVWKADPDHRRAYEAFEDVWRQAGALAGDPDIRAATVAASRSGSRGARPRWAYIAGAAACAAIVCVAAIGWLETRPQVLETAVGEQRKVRLSDGSHVALDTGSRVEVRLGEKRRDLSLTRGRALFEVAHGDDRPFRVRAGEATITATGTRFDVRRDGDGARVTLVEGSVTVDYAGGAGLKVRTLRPGQQLRAVRSDMRADEPRTVNVASVTSWTSGRLVFDGVPLAAVAAEINRYGDRPVTLGQGVDGTLPVSGVFDAGDSAAFADAVARVYGLEVRREAAAIVLRAPAGHRS